MVIVFKNMKTPRVMKGLDNNGHPGRSFIVKKIIDNRLNALVSTVDISPPAQVPGSRHYTSSFAASD